MKYRLVVVGAGKIAFAHLEAIKLLKQQLVPVAVADLLEERAQELAAAYGIRPYTDYKEMVEREKPDIVIITLPHFLHKEAAIYCANQGCHVLLEKPMALTVLECDEIIAAVHSSNVKLMVGHTQHYISENRKAKQIIEQGDLGQLVMINDSRHTDYFNQERPGWFLQKELSGGGIITNLGSHSVDKIQWLGGTKIKKVKASLSFHGPRGNVEGSGLVFLENESGTPSTISQSGYRGAPRNETELLFTGGMLMVQTGQALFISKGGAYEQISVEKEDSPFVQQFLELMTCIECDQEPECSMKYSRSIVAVTNAIYVSHELKIEVIV